MNKKGLEMAQKLDARIMMDILRGKPIKKEDLFAVATYRLQSLNDVISDFENGNMTFIDKKRFSDDEWDKMSEILWQRKGMRFVEHDGKMRLTQVSSPELTRKAEEEFRRTRPNATVEEMVDATHRAIQRDNYYHDQEMIMMKKTLERR